MNINTQRFAPCRDACRKHAHRFLPEARSVFEDSYSYMKPTISAVQISAAITNGGFLRQLDVSNVFLHDDIEEIIYIHQPSEFLDPVHTTYVYAGSKRPSMDSNKSQEHGVTNFAHFFLSFIHLRYVIHWPSSAWLVFVD